jgi:hypothetical protein
MLSEILFIPGLGWKEVIVPTGFDYTPPVTIQKFGKRTFRTNYNKENFKKPSAINYYLSPSGNDANDGLSSAAPKKSIRTLVLALNSSPPVGGATLFLEPGYYLGADGFNGLSVNWGGNIICESGVAISTTFQAATWTAEAGYDDIWRSSTLTSGTNQVIDLSDIDEKGLARNLKHVSSRELCESTPRSIFVDGTTVVVHLFDSREPDADVKPLIQSTGADLSQSTGQNLYFEGLQWWGRKPCQISATTAANIVFERCGLLYSSTENGLLITSATTSGCNVLLNNCVAAYNWADGFNYDGASRITEIGCIGFRNGVIRGAAGSSDNGSTTHANVRSVRVNGEYTYNDDRNQHDINTTRNWLLGCKAGFAQNGSASQFNNANFLFGVSSATDATLGWLDGCESLGGSASDLGAYGVNTVVRVRDGINLTLQAGNGTIESY